jgi:hypothetical protein
LGLPPLVNPYPALNLDFINNQTLDSRVTFSRGSQATLFDSTGTLVYAKHNLLAYSQDFATSPWGTTTAVVTVNTTVAPDGTTTADTVREDSSNDIQRVNYGSNIAPVGTVTGSVFVKAGVGTRFPTIGFQSASAAYASATFDLSTVTSTQTLSAAYTGVSAAITAVGSGWFRCSITCTVTAASAFFISLSNASTFVNGFRGAQIYAGDNTSSLIFWGAQVEVGAFATSYIPTTTTALTRNADVASMTGTNFSSWYNASEGTLFSNSLPPDAAAFFAFQIISDGTNANELQQRTVSGGTNPTFVVNTLSSTVASIGVALAKGVENKIASAYKVDDFQSAVNGALGTADNSGAVPTVTQLDLGRRANGTTYLNGHIRRIAYYPTRLPDTTLQGLTA